MVCSAPVVPVTTTTSTSTSSTDTTQPELGWRTDLRTTYVLGAQLGVGSFGSVHKAFHAESGEQVAVKTLPKERPKLSRAKVLEKLQRRVMVLREHVGLAARSLCAPTRSELPTSGVI